MIGPDKTRVALITGATGSVGMAIALRLLNSGFHVVASGRSTTGLAALDVHAQASHRLLTVAGDITDEAHVVEMFAAAAERFSPPTILINAVGHFGPIGKVTSNDPREWANTLAVNVTGPFLTCRAALSEMECAGWGRIVNVSSAQSLLDPDPAVSAYGVSKTALNFFTRCLAASLNDTDITACMIHPGDVRTNMWRSIRDDAADAGPDGAGLRDWARWVDSTGGDDPRLSADLVDRIIREPASWSNGRFLFIDGGLRPALPVPWEASGTP